jgi:hypothetical protein
MITGILYNTHKTIVALHMYGQTGLCNGSSCGRCMSVQCVFCLYPCVSTHHTAITPLQRQPCSPTPTNPATPPTSVSPALVGEPARPWLGLCVPSHHRLLLIQCPEPPPRLSHIRVGRRRVTRRVTHSRAALQVLFSIPPHRPCVLLLVLPLHSRLHTQPLPCCCLGSTPNGVHHPGPASSRLGGLDNARVLRQVRGQLHRGGNSRQQTESSRQSRSEELLCNSCQQHQAHTCDRR